MSSIKRLVFATGAIAGIAIITLLVLTLATGFRFWPPGEKSWKYHLHWGLVAIYELSVLIVAGLDWNSGAVPTLFRLFLGVPLGLLGTIVFLSGTNVMDTTETAGVEGELYTSGPYAYTRNPQYVGMILGRIGMLLVTNSRLVTALGTAQIAWVILLPFAEEPWLREQFGTEYERYRERVPRFVGCPTG